MDPAMDPDLVALSDDPPLLIGMEQGDDAGYVERRRHVVFLQQAQDAWHADAVAILTPGHAADRLAAVAQLAGLVVAVERDRKGATRPILPRLGPQRASGAYLVDQLAPVLLRPLPGFQRLLLVHER